MVKTEEQVEYTNKIFILLSMQVSYYVAVLHYFFTGIFLNLIFNQRKSKFIVHYQIYK